MSHKLFRMLIFAFFYLTMMSRAEILQDLKEVSEHEQICLPGGVVNLKEEVYELSSSNQVVVDMRGIKSQIRELAMEMTRLDGIFQSLAGNASQTITQRGEISIEDDWKGLEFFKFNSTPAEAIKKCFTIKSRAFGQLPSPSSKRDLTVLAQLMKNKGIKSQFINVEVTSKALVSGGQVLAAYTDGQTEATYKNKGALLVTFNDQTGAAIIAGQTGQTYESLCFVKRDPYKVNKGFATITVAGVSHNKDLVGKLQDRLKSFSNLIEELREKELDRTDVSGLTIETFDSLITMAKDINEDTLTRFDFQDLEKIEYLGKGIKVLLDSLDVEDNLLKVKMGGSGVASLMNVVSDHLDFTNRILSDEILFEPLAKMDDKVLGRFWYGEQNDDFLWRILEVHPLVNKGRTFHPEQIALAKGEWISMSSFSKQNCLTFNDHGLACKLETRNENNYCGMAFTQGLVDEEDYVELCTMEADWDKLGLDFVEVLCVQTTEANLVIQSAEAIDLDATCERVRNFEIALESGANFLNLPGLCNLYKGKHLIHQSSRLNHLSGEPRILDGNPWMSSTEEDIEEDESTSQTYVILGLVLGSLSLILTVYIVLDRMYRRWKRRSSNREGQVEYNRGQVFVNVGNLSRGQGRETIELVRQNSPLFPPGSQGNRKAIRAAPKPPRL